MHWRPGASGHRGRGWGHREARAGTYLGPEAELGQHGEAAITHFVLAGPVAAETQGIEGDQPQQARLLPTLPRQHLLHS